MTRPRQDEFAGQEFDFAVGEVYGLRVWVLDVYGRLRARHMSSAPAWRPGVNTATCLATATFSGGLRAIYAAAMGVAVSPAPEQEPHRTPDEGCSCGFYAYSYPGYEMVADVGAVVGVIRGTGRTLIGTRGFRCEKAEIVALLDPTAERPAWALYRDRLRVVYPQVPLLGSIAELTEFAPIESTAPDPSTDDFWDL